MEGSDSWGTRKENFPLPPVLSPLWQRRDISLICKEGRAEDSLCLSVSLFGGCLAAAWSVSVPLAYLWHPFQSPLWNAEMVLCRGATGHISWQRPVWWWQG